MEYLAPRSNATKSSSKQKNANTDMEVAGEYQQLMEQEFFDFVLFEVPWIVN
jgi:V-type H+-transporting ATPase subunit C